MTTPVAIMLLALGMAGVLRAVVIVASGRTGRFALDPWITLVVGFGLILVGEALLV